METMFPVVYSPDLIAPGIHATKRILLPPNKFLYVNVQSVLKIDTRS